ncbi:MAG TPA: tetratricopeptide repeat protein [Verrucomicrobiae bacterium]|nr:tetratricopeptide repeat protein [Verrucomicrobiae bacterium]
MMSGTDHLPDFGAKSMAADGETAGGHASEKRLERQNQDGNFFPKAQSGLPGWLFGSLFGAMLLAYVAISACCIHAPFFPLDDLDELYMVRTNSSWLSLLGTDLYHFLRPVKNVLFAIYNWLYSHGGMVPVHLMAMVIGLLSACAVFKLCCRVLVDRGWALAATAVWLLSPTLVSSTAYLSASTNIMPMAGFGAAALAFHDIACESEELAGKVNFHGVIWTALALLCLFLSFLSYEGALPLVAMFFVMDWYLRPARLQRFATWRLYFLYGVALLIYLVLRHEAHSVKNVLGSFSNVTRPQIAMSAGYFTLLHTGVWLWPFNRLAIIGGYYWGQIPMVELVVCYLIVLAAAAFSLIYRRRYPLVTLGILWFLLAFAPMSNLLGFRNGPYGDYYMSLASIGLAIAFTAILRALWPLRTAGISRIGALVAIALLIGWRTAAAFEAASWSYAWNDPAVVYERTLRTFPQSFDAMNDLAKIYEARGKYNEADQLAARSIELAPDRPGAYSDRAVIAEQEGRYQDALKYLELSNSHVIGPVGAWALTCEGDIYANHLGQPERGEALYRQAVAWTPWTQDSLRAAYELAYMEARQGNRAGAIALWEKLLTYNPDDGVLHWDLSIAYGQLGNKDLSAYHLRIAKALGNGTNQLANGMDPAKYGH